MMGFIEFIFRLEINILKLSKIVEICFKTVLLQEAGKILRKLKRVWLEYSTPIFLMDHITKSEGSSAVYNIYSVFI